MANFLGLEIPEDKKRYIGYSLSPILVDLMTSVISEQTADPIGYMVEWLESQPAVTYDPRQQLLRDNVQLRKEYDSLQTQLKDVSSLALKMGKKFEDQKEEEQEEDFDFACDVSVFCRQKRGAVACQPHDNKTDVELVSFPKSSRHKKVAQTLQSCPLLRNFPFHDTAAFDALLGCVQEESLNEGEEMDSTDHQEFFFILDDGEVCRLDDSGAASSVRDEEMYAREVAKREDEGASVAVPNHQPNAAGGGAAGGGATATSKEKSKDDAQRPPRSSPSAKMLNNAVKDAVANPASI